MWVSSSAPPPAAPQQDPHVYLSSCAFLNPPLPLGIPTWISGGVVCFRLTHETLSTRQYILARLKKVRDTEHRAHRYPPRSFLPRAHHTSSRHLEANPNFEDFCSAKETYFCSAQTLLLNLLGFQTYKSRERRIRKKNCFPGHFDGVDQLLFDIGNFFCSNGVRA